MPLAKIAVLIVELTPSPLKGEAGWGWGGGRWGGTCPLWVWVSERGTEWGTKDGRSGQLCPSDVLAGFKTSCYTQLSFSSHFQQRTVTMQGFWYHFIPFRTRIHTYKKPIYSDQLSHLSRTSLEPLGGDPHRHWEVRSHTENPRGLPATRQRH